MADEGALKRRFPRYRTGLDVVVYQGSQARQGRITQISRGGILIFPPLAPAQSPEIKLSFRLADDQPYINCKGEIAYSISDKGTGVAFTEISLYNQDLITAFFDKQLAAEKPAGA